MKDHITDYKKRLEKGICEYMDMPVSERASTAIIHMVDCWTALDKMTRRSDAAYTFDDAAAMRWNAMMQNSDGTSGGHWTVDQTAGVAADLGVQFTHITPAIWNVAMNMMYSDYCNVASMYGVSTPNFYGEMAKAFLFDKDGPGPKEKMAAYFCNIVNH